MEPSVTGMNSAERYSEPTPGVPHFGGTPPKLKTHPPLVAMLMGLPVKVFSVIVVMSPAPRSCYGREIPTGPHGHGDAHARARDYGSAPRPRGHGGCGSKTAEEAFFDWNDGRLE